MPNSSPHPSASKRILLGLIGAGIQSSLTPAMHERECSTQGLRCLYQLIDLDELHLTVFVGNEPARHLYAATGYEQLDDDGRQCRLRKRLSQSSREHELA